MTVNRLCASGLEAVNIGAAKVAAGFSDLVICGGVESMSRVPMGSEATSTTTPHFRVRALGAHVQLPGCPDFVHERLTDRLPTPGL